MLGLPLRPVVSLLSAGSTLLLHQHMLQLVPLQLHCTENPNYVFPEKKLRGLNPNSYIHVERFIYSQDWSTYVAAAK
jgi:hypothetical protein